MFQLTQPQRMLQELLLKPSSPKAYETPRLRDVGGLKLMGALSARAPGARPCALFPRKAEVSAVTFGDLGDPKHAGRDLSPCPFTL